MPVIQSSRLVLGAIVGSVLLAIAFTAFDIVPAASQEATLRAWRTDPDATLMDPWSSLWGDVKPTVVALSSQNATKPIGGGEVATLRARALHDRSRLYVMLEWNDKTVDDAVVSHTAFADGVAVELPSVAGVSIPSFCMGDANGSVNIWHWKAAWQRDIDDGYLTVAGQFRNIQVDGYLVQEDPVFQPARILGNPLSQKTRSTPIENLVAASYGTLTTADLQDVQGAGVWRDGRWRVVFARPLVTASGYPSLAEGDVTNVAFAVWDGSRGNRDGLKSVSQFMNLQVSASLLPPAEAGLPAWGWALIGVVLAVAVAALGWAYAAGGLRRA